MTLDVSLRCVQRTLPNGLRVFVHEDRTVPLVAVNLWYHVGSRNERSGRTGFAHLFEHLMFEGSAHVPPGRFDQMLESVGGVNNGSTSTDRTNYWETVPSHALDVPLFLESDRLGWLAPAVTQEKLEAQREVVKNERRQSYENRPYGLAWETLRFLLYPEGHPYRWPVIGHMADIEAATMEDVLSFFHTWYTPGNATLAIAGDVSAEQAFDRVLHWFGDIPASQAAPTLTPPPAANGARRGVIEDAVQLPRLHLAWHTPRTFAAGDAELDLAAHVLAHGRASRLFRALVYELEIAQDVDAMQRSSQLGSVFCIVATARPGVSLDRLEEAARAELERLARDGPDAAELERARNVVFLSFCDALQTVGGFGGKADRLNLYAFHTGDPEYAQRDLARFERVDAAGVVRVVRERLVDVAPTVLAVVPKDGRNLAPAAVEDARVA